jgi:signal transduction histidine kinase
VNAVADDVRLNSRAPRWWRDGTRTPLWWAAAVVAPLICWADVYGWWDATGDPVAFWWGIGILAEIVVGLLFWMWRPGNLVGPLLVTYATLAIGEDLLGVVPDSRLAVTVGFLFYWSFWPVYVTMVFMFPNGELIRSRWARGVLVATYVWAFLIYVPGLLFAREGIPFTNFNSSEVPSYLYVGHGWSGLATWDRVWWIGQWALTLCAAAVLVVRLVQATPGARRRLLPLFLAVIILKTADIGYLVVHLVRNDAWAAWYPYVLLSFFLVSAAGAAFGLTRVRHARSSVSDLVVELGQVEPGHVRDALARTLGDPSLVLGLWLPERGGWADEQGQEIVVPQDGSRGVTYVGERLAVLIHDRDLLDQPRLLESVGSAARLALENERLQAELRAQLAELRDSRARIVAAGDEERRRLERDLHDGAQQRLLGLGMALQLLRTNVTDGEKSQALLDETEAELHEALAELRELARGIHPAVLTDQGLDAALRTLAERAPLAVTVEGDTGRLPPHVETAAYFVAAEALANVVKHAAATKVVIRSAHHDGTLTLEIADDGVGGAHQNGGTGLRGLADRVGALDGRLAVDSAPGAGTRVRVEIPVNEPARAVLVGAP